MAFINCTVDRSAWYRMYIEYTISTSTASKESTITHALKIEQLTDSYDFNGNMNVTYYVAGKAYSYNGNIDMNDKGNKGYTITIKSGTTTIKHDAKTGDASFKISCNGSCASGGYGPGNISLSETTIKCSRIPLYTLSISAGTGSSITVERTSSGGSGGTGNLSAGSNKLYYGDKLKITFTPSANYSITTHTVNNKDFTSGDTHTVSADVAVKAAATPLKSAVAATDANIESTSSIIITRYNNSYTHTLTYKFGSLTGTIVENSTETAIPFPIPPEFYAQIPDDPDGICTITCTTYNGDKSLGDTTCKMTVTAAKKLCAPVVTIEAVDSNPATVALTGDNKKIIRFHSDISVKATVKEQNGSYIKSTTLKCGAATANGTEKTFADAESPAVSATAIDSRGYDATVEVEGLELIEYEKLTVNASASRPGPTATAVNITAKGNYYNGSFGAVNNTLRLQAQYKLKTKEAYDETDAWTELTVTISGNTYTAEGTLTDLDYRQLYDIRVQAQDAIHKPEGPLADAVHHNITLNKGIPIFDWGEDDFRFNVPISIESQPVKDFIIEQGISDNWIYEKWFSGIAKCYGTISKDENATIYDSTAGEAKVAYISLANEFPEGLFKNKPFVFATAIDSGTGNVTAEDFASTAAICNVTVWGTNTAIGGVNVMAVGIWK